MKIYPDRQEFKKIRFKVYLIIFILLFSFFLFYIYPSLTCYKLSGDDECSGNFMCKVEGGGAPWADTVLGTGGSWKPCTIWDDFCNQKSCVPKFRL